MILTNVRIVLIDRIIEKGFIRFEDGIIKEIGDKPYEGKEEALDKSGFTLMPGFIDIHIHGSMGIDFMDATEEQYKLIADSLYEEGVTTFLATTLTSDKDSLARVCKTVKNVKDEIPSLGGIHFEGPYISLKYKGAQNPEFIRDPNIAEFDELNRISGGNVKYIAMAPEKDGAMEFIKHLHDEGVVLSAGHTDASFDVMKEAIKNGLTNTTHTHNAMSPHHHRNPGVVSAAMYFDELYCEVICDLVHVCPNALRTFYKVIGEDRFVMITDALKVKHTDIKEFQLFGLDCVTKPDAAYLTTGPLAGSLLTMDQGLRNLKDVLGADLIALAKMASSNAAKSLHFDDRGEIKENKLADLVLLDDTLHIKEVYKLGKRVK